MKNIVKGQEPTALANYVQANPTNTWEQCARSKTRREVIQKEIRLNQGGLCAYCEIDLKPADANGHADFRVEHFHPKSDTSSAHNWHLDWRNLLGCCHGGSQRGVTDAADRFSINQDYSCDVPKADNNWDADILNPLSIPSSPALFSYHRTSGDMTVNTGNCQQAGVDGQKAQNTIDYLHLNANRLTRLRRAELNAINALFSGLVKSGMTDSDARVRLAQAILRKNNDNWPTFFSAARSYLGQAAEEQLGRIGYVG